MNLESARQQMLSQQIRTWDVLNPLVLDTLKTTPREAFVPKDERELAFADIEIPLPHGQYMMAPKVEARLLQELALEATDEVLEIGTGSGYLSACLAKLVANLTSVEIFADLSDAAGAKLRNSGIDNVELLVEDAMQAAYGRKFDAIAVTAAVPTLTDQFTQLLKPGGRLFIVVGYPPAMQATLVRLHEDGGLLQKSLFETVLAPLINSQTPQPFVL